MLATRPTLALSRTLVRLAATPSPSLASTSTFAARVKKSTNITGLDVSTSPLAELESRYQKTLSLLTTLPEASVYRQATSALTQQRLAIVTKYVGEANAVKSQPEQIEGIYEQAEAELDAGQLEQVLEQAQAEYRLAAKMVDWKAWEPLEHPPAPGQWSYFSMAEEAGEGGEDQNVGGGKQ
ncbi:ETC complex I subunit [Kalmanozyma brasiliensis GHG001]|uniref:Putative mitochondrial Complex I, B13_NDUFA5 subunit n=1 Tax=Kalmanozyma brasiliensis (strain GHG001) TaxID=1365824 RepID=V5EIP4_KALBG|nr:ETC complex I subunit [Kalmanozyma brasiliensis GHG001]EST04525.1 ETC complex I subunit [Kalmanozyma brasiliensis GHG001]